MFVQHEQHMGSAVWWEGASCLVQVKHWCFSGHGHRIQDVSVWRRLLKRLQYPVDLHKQYCVNFWELSSEIPFVDHSLFVVFVFGSLGFCLFFFSHLFYPAYLFLYFIFCFFLSHFLLCISSYFSFHRKFLLGGWRQRICCFQSFFPLISVFNLHDT